MVLTLEEINLLARYGFDQFQVSAMTQEEEARVLNAIKGLPETDPDGERNNKRIWGLENAHE